MRPPRKLISTIDSQKSAKKPNPIRFYFISWFLIPLAVAVYYFRQATVGTDDTFSSSSCKEISSFNASLFWGTYRANLFAGCRTRYPQSLMTGWSWFDAESPALWKEMRLDAESPLHNGLDRWAYLYHDGTTTAKQKIIDTKHNVIVTHEFSRHNVYSGSHGGDWVMQSHLKIHKKSETRPSLLFHIYHESNATVLHRHKVEFWNELSAQVLRFSGDAPDVGKFSLFILDDPSNENMTSLEGFQFWSTKLPQNKRWAFRQSFEEHIFELSTDRIKSLNSRRSPVYSYLTSLNNEDKWNSNFHLIQRTTEKSLKLNVVFVSHSAHANEPIRSTVVKLLQDAKVESDERRRNIENRIKSQFPVRALTEQSNSTIPSNRLLERVVQYAISNLLGGISYFHGSGLVQFNKTTAVKAQRPCSLFTDVPCRPFFPRGFLWDTGFHQLVISQWDPLLSIEILRNWLSLRDKNGWIGREQILGLEARSKVPDEFQVQRKTFSNPPALILPVWWMVQRAKGNNSILNELEQILDPLVHNYEWFRANQRGQILSVTAEVYRWRGRLTDHTLTSGLDDYPRAPNPSTDELHVDLISWMAFVARQLSLVFTALRPQDERGASYGALSRTLIENLEKWHWDEQTETYCDLFFVNETVTPIRHIGYVSLFPFMFGLIDPKSPRLLSTLNIIRNPDHLWSPFGLRSLSSNDQYYGVAENYWRGPIWMNINYLVLAALFTRYSRLPGPYQELASETYKELRLRLVTAVATSFEGTGTLWEQYSPSTGKGQRNGAFTGWTSLIALIIAEQYPEMNE